MKAPIWLGVAKELFKTEGIFTGEELKRFVRLCFEDDHRECHYLGLQMVEKTIKKQSKDYIHFLEELILTNSWWDSVDWLSKMVSMHFQRFPDLLPNTPDRWIESDHMWLQRVAIIFQRYKKYPTDWAMLQRYILKHQHSQEFFIQKAMGWALRDESKEHPAEVLAFIKANALPKLTQREGLKWLKKEDLV